MSHDDTPPTSKISGHSIPFEHSSDATLSSREGDQQPHISHAGQCFGLTAVQLHSSNCDQQPPPKTFPEISQDWYSPLMVTWRSCDKRVPWIHLIGPVSPSNHKEVMSRLPFNIFGSLTARKWACVTRTQIEFSCLPFLHDAYRSTQLATQRMYIQCILLTSISACLLLGWRPDASRNVKLRIDCLYRTLKIPPHLALLQAPLRSSWKLPKMDEI